jgi:hypothetical protein
MFFKHDVLSMRFMLMLALLVLWHGSISSVAKTQAVETAPSPAPLPASPYKIVRWFFKYG